jgi:hypothetical protein
MGILKGGKKDLMNEESSKKGAPKSEIAVQAHPTSAKSPP